MKNNLDISKQQLYPHLKITDEKFPRLLVTRKIENDGAEYFGAFLPETGGRFFTSFLDKLFKLRNCTIEIDGDFVVPCPQFYAKRCVAPCVENICDEKEYNETVELLRLFLRRENDELKNKLLEKIEKYAEVLDFETASEWRDRLQTIENFWSKNEWVLWLDDATDSWKIERKNGEIFVYLVTMRGRKNLGRLVFVFDDAKEFSNAEILERILPEFYRLHAPAEIRVPVQIPNRKQLTGKLSKRENRKIKITVIGENNKKKTVGWAIERNKHEFNLKEIKPIISTKDLQKEFKRIFELKRMPKRIEAFDVAHISGTNSVGANVVWEKGKFVADEYKFWQLDETSELKTLEKSIELRFSNEQNAPDFLLIDGGNSQLNAALKALKDFTGRKFFIISAVKPPKQHSEISHFLTENGEKILFDRDSEAFLLLRQIRDEAHNTANSIHRTRRDFSHFYELASVLPSLDEKMRRAVLQKFGSIRKLKEVTLIGLIENFDAAIAQVIFMDLQNYRANGEQNIKPPIVPIRYDEPNGDAQDLQPLRSL